MAAVEREKKQHPKDAVEKATNIGSFLKRRETNFRMYYERERRRIISEERRKMRGSQSTDSD